MTDEASDGTGSGHGILLGPRCLHCEVLDLINRRFAAADAGVMIHRLLEVVAEIIASAPTQEQHRQYLAEVAVELPRIVDRSVEKAALREGATRH